MAARRRPPTHSPPTDDRLREIASTLNARNDFGAFSLSSTAPAGAVSMRVWFYAEAGRTTTIDDLDLRKTSCTGTTTGDSCSLVLNPDFEISAAGWFTNTNPQLTGDAAAGVQAISVSNGWLSTATFAQPGTTYTGSAMIKSSGTGWSGLGVDFVDGNGTKLGDAVATIEPGTAYSPISVTGVAPPGTVDAQFWFFAESGRTTLIDSADLRVTGCN